LNLPEGSVSTSTIESKTNFLRAVRSGHVTADARPLHAGRSVIAIETSLALDDGSLVAKTIQTQAVLRESDWPRRHPACSGHSGEDFSRACRRG
jgi:acyl-coenzyme A thioesterase PaaI-like protein